MIISSYPDSIVKFRADLIKEFQNLGMVVHVAVPDIQTYRSSYEHLKLMNLVIHDIALKRTGLSPVWDLITLFQLTKIMFNVKPSYVLSYTAKPVIYGTIAAKISGVKHRFSLITGVGYAFTGAATGLHFIVRSLLIKMYRFSLQFSEKIFFQNRDDHSLFISEKILDRDYPVKIVNGSGVNLTKFKFEPHPDRLSFLMIARLLGNKGVREYVDAAQKIKRAHPGVVFILVGWLDQNPDSITQSELDRWISEGTVLFLGKLDDVRESIANCSVFVLPSYREGTPRTVLEALAMGRAIITTDAPGCRETVVDGQNGFLVPVNSVDDLENRMLKFISNPNLVINMGIQSRKIAEEKYNVDLVNAEMLKGMGIVIPDS